MTNLSVSSALDYPSDLDQDLQDQAPAPHGLPSPAARPHLAQTSPEEAVACLRAIDEPTLVVLDFDETLFLRNSTEAYLDTLRPQALGALFLQVIDKLKPWRFLPSAIGGFEARDWLRVVLATLLFPWTLVLWRRRVRSLMQTYENKPLAQAVSQNPHLQVIIATRGFDFIVRPMIPYLSLQPEQVIGCRFWRGGWDRQRGKDELIAGHVDPLAVQTGVLVTDSLDDASLLRRVQYPLWVQWEDAQYIPALTQTYLPFFYLERVKRPGTRFTYTVILKNHLICLLLAYSWIAASPLLHGLGMVCLLVSFWCVYEIGYFENDRVAEQYEAKPVLSETYHQYKARMDGQQPWLFAALAGWMGVMLIHLGQDPAAMAITTLQTALGHLTVAAIAPLWVGWMGVLAITRLIYSAYNYIDEKTRIWLYPLLQMTKYFGFLVVTGTNIVGFLLLVSQLFVDWIPYVIYRCGGDRHRFEEQILRLVIFLLLTVGLAITEGSIAWVMTAQFAVVLGWLLVRSRPQVLQLSREAHLVSSQR